MTSILTLGDTDEAKTTLDDKDVQCRPRNEKSLEDYETWTNCPNGNTYFVKNLFEEKNDKFSHIHRLGKQH